MKHQVRAKKEQFVRSKNVILAEADQLKIKDDQLTQMKQQYQEKESEIEAQKREIIEKQESLN